MKKSETKTEALTKIETVDKISREEELDFLDYQETVTRTKEAKRNRRILIALTSAIYLIGLGLFASIVQTIYQINNTAGIIVAIVLLVLYTILYIVMIVSIFSKHSFDLEFQKRKNGKLSERNNNKVRIEIARNLREQNTVLSYLEKKKEKEVLSEKETQKVNAFERILDLAEKYEKKVPDINSQDSKNLLVSLRIAFEKDGVIYKKAKKMIFKRSIETGTMTALSQNAIFDGSIVAMKNMQLVKDIIWLYGFRPTNYEMNKILLRVIRNVSIALGLNTMPKAVNITSKIFNKDSSNFLVSLLGQAIDMGAQFVGNGVMTYIVGKYTIRAMLKEYHIQDLFAQKCDEEYELDMNEKVYKEINEAIHEEVSVLKSKEKEKVNADC